MFHLMFWTVWLIKDHVLSGPSRPVQSNIVIVWNGMGQYLTCCFITYKFIKIN